MKLILEFNKVIHKKELIDFMNFELEPAVKRSKQYFAAGFLALGFGIFILLKSNNPNLVLCYLLIAFGAHVILKGINHFQLVYKAKKIYRINIDLDVNRMNSQDQKIVMEFNDDYFYYEEKDYNSKILWHMFKKIRNDGSYIYMDMSRGVQTTYIINKTVVGEEAFEKIGEIVNQKIARDSTPTN